LTAFDTYIVCSAQGQSAFTSSMYGACMATASALGFTRFITAFSGTQPEAEMHAAAWGQRAPGLETDPWNRLGHGLVGAGQLLSAGLASGAIARRVTAPVKPDSRQLPPGFKQTGPNTWEGTIEVRDPTPGSLTLPASRGPFGPMNGPPGMGPGPGRGPLGPLPQEPGWSPPLKPGDLN